MANFFTDNKDLLFQFDRLNLKEVVNFYEENYNQSKKFNYAPINYEDAMENYRRILEITGDIAANYIAPRSPNIDEEGAVFKDGKVSYAKGTQESLILLSKAELMGMILPREYGGINFATTYYINAGAIICYEDASLIDIL